MTMRDTAAPSPEQEGNEETGRGASAALTAFLIWGFLPIYWKLLESVNPFEVVSHRGIWSLASIIPLVLLTRRMPEVRAALRGKSLLLLCLSTALLAANWLIFIWAVGNGRILETSIGNFLNPLFNMMCGVVFFRDRITRLQWFSVLLVTIAIGLRIVTLGYFPWVALSLCCTFSFYGMIRKIVSVESIPGLMVENTLFAPFALGTLLWLGSQGTLSFGSDATTTAMLLGAGAFTSIPIALFAYAARHLHLTTLGIFHYIVPSCSFLIGVFMYHEPLSAMSLATFALIWLALIVYTIEKLRIRRRPSLIRNA